jgi:hypothetical protein
MEIWSDACRARHRSTAAGFAHTPVQLASAPSENGSVARSCIPSGNAPTTVVSRSIVAWFAILRTSLALTLIARTAALFTWSHPPAG